MTIDNTRRRLLYAATLCSTVLCPVMARAQTDTTNGQIEEVVVTAEKRAENAQDIPKTVEVLGPQTLTQANVSGLQELSQVSPSIQGIANGPALLPEAPAIRGITSFAYSIGVQAQTGIVLDDVPQGNFSTLADELADVQRVEVLPGPQSTLSGRNAAGGLINIVTRSPSDTLTAEGTAEVTDDRQKRLAGYVAGPIDDQLGFSLSGYWDDWDGPLRNAATGDWLGGWNRSGVRGKLKYQPIERFTATFTAYYTHNDALTQALIGGYTYVDLPPSTLTYFTGSKPLASLLKDVDAAPYNHDIYSIYRGTLNSNDAGASLRLAYDTSVGTLTSITTYSRSLSRSYTPLFAFSSFPDNQVLQGWTVNSLIQELRLASSDSDSPLQYLVGLIYDDNRVIEPYDRPVIEADDWYRTSHFQSIALYSHATYAIFPTTFLTAGLRLEEDIQSYGWEFLDQKHEPFAPSQGSNTYGFPTGELSLRQELSDDISAYVTYANSQTGRAYDLEDNASAETPAGLKPLSSEKVQSYEAGVKSEWLDKRLTLNASLFDAYYRGYQIQSAYFTGPNTLPVIRLFSIGRVETRGLELQAAYAATPDLTMNAAATFLNAMIRDYPDAPCYTGQTLPASCLMPGSLQGNLAGLSMPGASNFKATASAAYTLEMPSMPFDAVFDGLLRYQSGTHTSLYGDPVSHIDGYEVFNLTGGLRNHDGNITLQFFVDNLFDDKHYDTLDRDPTVYNPAGVNPTSIIATYDRDSRRYAGVRLTLEY